MTEVRYLAPAENELLEAIRYFSTRATGLGRRLLAEVRQAEVFLAEFPEASREVRPGIRIHSLRKFPYSLVYTIDPQGILILAVAHQSRRPGYWSSRG